MVYSAKKEGAMKQLFRNIRYLLWQCWHMLTCRECDLDEVTERYGIY